LHIPSILYCSDFISIVIVLLLAILSECQLILVIDLPKIIQVVQGVNIWTNYMCYIPIPAVLIVSVILLILIPRPESRPMWIDREEQKTWWKKTVRKIDNKGWKYV
jgi:hypothetical protein